jgi:hypothetical protein
MAVLLKPTLAISPAQAQAIVDRVVPGRRTSRRSHRGQGLTIVMRDRIFAAYGVPVLTA